MWSEFYDVFSPNAERQEPKIEKIEDKYYKYAIVRYILRMIKKGDK